MAVSLGDSEAVSEVKLFKASHTGREMTMPSQ